MRPRCVLCGKRIWVGHAWMRWLGAWKRVHRQCYASLDPAEWDFLTNVEPM